ncbi:preprotein translocase subunit YajC [Candidatus Eisenbacteria bacterium]|uniref:Preprotein translocase subunit YajC n=1 Tax=Eiseniibacteriota bacterium TaxID=2212470 RepID=A0ABV6YJE9_UNCEI
MAYWTILMSGAGGEAGQQQNPLVMLLPFVLIFAIFYLLIIRPQQKRQKQHQKMLGSVQNGDRVLTTGGLIGNVVGTKEENGVQILVLKIADNTKVEVSRGHLHQIIIKSR